MNPNMEEEEDAMAKNNKATVRSKKQHARLHRSFLRFSKVLKKLHGRGRATGNGEPPPRPSSSSSTSFLSGCMHPRTHSFASGRHHRHKHQDEGDALAVNFRSLRLGPSAVDAAGEDGSSTAPDHSDGGSEDREGVPRPAAATGKAVIGGAGVAVVAFSAAPYEDFRRSMREMVDAARRDQAGSGGAVPRAPAVDWDFMEELLFCYIHLNDRAVHRDILRAFTDTVAALRRRRRAAAAPVAKSRRTRRQRRQRRSATEDGRDDDDAEEALPSS